MGWLQTTRRIATRSLGLRLRLLDTLGQSDGVNQKKLGEALHLMGFLCGEFFLFVVCCIVAFKPDQVCQVRHRWSDLALFGQGIDSINELHFLEVNALWGYRPRVACIKRHSNAIFGHEFEPRSEVAMGTA